MSRTVPDIDALEEVRKRRVTQDARMRAINRLRRLKSVMTQYSRQIVAKFVDDAAVNIERFRLLVILAGFPVNALFTQKDGETVPCMTKAEIVERMKRVDEVVDINEEKGQEVGKEKRQGGDNLIDKALKVLWFPFVNNNDEPIINNLYQALGYKVDTSKELTSLTLKFVAFIVFVVVAKRIGLGHVVHYIFIGPPAKRPPALSHDDIRALPLRPGWEMRENTKGLYFFHKPSKRYEKRIPVLSDEVPHNWVEWIVPKTNKSEYENVQTGVKLDDEDAYKLVQQDMKNGELKREWTESIDDNDQHHWHPPSHSPYKAESYEDRPLDKPRLEKKYGVMAWEYWAVEHEEYTPGEVRYQFLCDADTDLYFDTIYEVKREYIRRASSKGTPVTRTTPTHAPPRSELFSSLPSSLPTSKSAENMADIQHEID